MATIQEIESKPEFAAYTYDQQIKIRTAYAKKYLPANPEFAKYNPAEKQAIVDALIFRPPVFEDKNLQSQVDGLWQRAKQGDKKAKDKMMNMVVFSAFEDQSLIVSLFDHALVAPIAEAVQGNSSLTPDLEYRQLTISPEGRKAIQFFDTAISQDTQMAKKLGVYKTIASVGGFLADFAGLYVGLAGTAVKSARGVGKLALYANAKNAIEASATTPARMMLASLAGEAAHAGVTASIGVAREWGLELMKENLGENHGFQEIASKSARWFGEYFLGDLVVNWATGVVWPMAKVFGTKGIKGYGDVATVYKNLNAEEWKKLSHYVFSGEDIPKDLLVRLPEHVQKEAISSMTAFKLMKNVGKLSDMEASVIIANKNGFNMIPIGEGKFEISPKIGKSPAKKVSSAKEINDYMMENMKKAAVNPIFKKKDVKEFAKKAAGADKVHIKTVIQGYLPEKYNKNADVLTRLIAPQGGEFKKSQVDGFVKAYAKGSGVSDDVVKQLRVVAEKDSLKVLKSNEEIFKLPKKVLDAEEEKSLVKNLLETLETHLPGEGLPKELRMDFLKNYSERLVKQSLFTPEYAAHVADISLGSRLLKDENGWKLVNKLSGKEIQRFADFKSAADFIIRKNISVETLKLAAERQGMTLTLGKGDVYKLKKGPRVIAQGATLEGILQQTPDLVPKFDSALGPEITLVSPTGALGVRFTKDSIAVSSHENLMKFLGNFQRKSYGGNTVSIIGGNKGRIEFYKKRKQFEVLIDDIGERRTFSQVRKAKEYLDGAWKQVDELKFSAAKKGYRLDYKAGHWFLYSSEGDKLTFKSFEEANKALKDVPIPEWAPELSGIPEELLDGFQRPPQDFFRVPEEALQEGPLDYSVRAMAGQLWTPTKSTLEKFVAEGADPEVIKTFNNIESTRLFVAGREHEFRKVVLSIFEDKGKVVSKKKRYWIGRYAEAADDTARAKVLEDARKTGVKFGTKETEMAEKLREFYGKTPEEGAFAYFGVAPEKFIDNYLPRVKEYYYQNPKKAWTDGNVHGFLAEVFDNKVPKEMTAFFKHARVSDVLDVALEKDPLAQLFRYVNAGLKEKYIGPLIDEATKLTALKGDKVLRKRFYTYLSQIGGLPQGDAQQIIRQITPKILQAFKLPPTLTNDITTWFMSLGYSASMGFRPWLPIRNMNQIWTTLAMRMHGNRWVKDALQKVASKDGGVIYDTLRKKGLIMSSLPLYGSEVIDQASMLGKITHSSLKMYKNSDDFTRAVAYTAASLKFDDAWGRLKKGILNQDKFLHMSGVSQMDPTTRGKILGLINEGKVTSARDMFATEIVTETMFPYRAGMSPLAFRTTIGKVFGMMGHYSVYYVDNIRRSLKYMTAGEKMLAGSIFVGNSMALYGAFSTLGVKADNFKPWEPAIFTGGPSWEIMQDALDMAGSGGEGKAARMRLFGVYNDGERVRFDPLKSTLFKWTIPGAYELKKMSDAVELTNRGDSWGAFLTSMGAPYSDSWLFGD